MRDKWHGDNRDWVKWGVLLELANRYQARQILQVLYQRSSTWERLISSGRTTSSMLQIEFLAFFDGRA